MKVLVGVPCMESLPVEYVNCLLQLKKTPTLKFPTLKVEVMHDPLSLVYIARERIAGFALKGNFDYVLFIDSDMVFPANTLVDLLEYDRDIVGALTFQRKPPYSPCVYTKLKIGEPGETIMETLKEYTPGLLPVEGIGFGCTMVKTKVFEAVYKAGGGTCFHPILGYGEDLSFCIRARHAKHKIFVDTTLKVGHLGKMICTEDTFKAWNEASA